MCLIEKLWNRIEQGQLPELAQEMKDYFNIIRREEIEAIKEEKENGTDSER